MKTYKNIFYENTVIKLLQFWVVTIKNSRLLLIAFDMFQFIQQIQTVVFYSSYTLTVFVRVGLKRLTCVRHTGCWIKLEIRKSSTITNGITILDLLPDTFVWCCLIGSHTVEGRGLVGKTSSLSQTNQFVTLQSKRK